MKLRCLGLILLLGTNSPIFASKIPPVKPPKPSKPKSSETSGAPHNTSKTNSASQKQSMFEAIKTKISGSKQGPKQDPTQPKAAATKSTNSSSSWKLPSLFKSKNSPNASVSFKAESSSPSTSSSARKNTSLKSETLDLGSLKAETPATANTAPATSGNKSWASRMASKMEAFFSGKQKATPKPQNGSISSKSTANNEPVTTEKSSTNNTPNEQAPPKTVEQLKKESHAAYEKLSKARENRSENSAAYETALKEYNNAETAHQTALKNSSDRNVTQSQYPAKISSSAQQVTSTASKTTTQPETLEQLKNASENAKQELIEAGKEVFKKRTSESIKKQNDAWQKAINATEAYHKKFTQTQLQSTPVATQPKTGQTATISNTPQNTARSTGTAQNQNTTKSTSTKLSKNEFEQQVKDFADFTGTTESAVLQQKKAFERQKAQENWMNDLF